MEDKKLEEAELAKETSSDDIVADDMGSDESEAEGGQ